MQFIQMNLGGVEQPISKEECFIHEFKFSGRVSTLNSQTDVTLASKLKKFNQNNLLTKFILNQESNTTRLDAYENPSVELHVVQLAGKEPIVDEIQFFVKQLGLEDLQGSLRSYPAQMKIPSIEPNEHGLTHFLNELFWSSQSDRLNNVHQSANFDSILKQYCNIFQTLSFEMDLFSTTDFGKDASHQYLKLTDLMGQPHCFKVSYWTEHWDGYYFYSMSQRIELAVFEQEREDYRHQLNKQLECLNGTQSFDVFLPF